MKTFRQWLAEAQEQILKNPKFTEIFGALNPEDNPVMAQHIQAPSDKYIFKGIFDVRTDTIWVAWAGGIIHDTIATKVNLFLHNEKWNSFARSKQDLEKYNFVIPFYMNLKTRELEISIGDNAPLEIAKKMVTGRLKKFVKTFKVTYKTFKQTQYDDYI